MAVHRLAQRIEHRVEVIGEDEIAADFRRRLELDRHQHDRQPENQPPHAAPRALPGGRGEQSEAKGKTGQNRYNPFPRRRRRRKRQWRQKPFRHQPQRWMRLVKNRLQAGGEEEKQKRQPQANRAAQRHRAQPCHQASTHPKRTADQQRCPQQANLKSDTFRRLTRIKKAVQNRVMGHEGRVVPNGRHQQPASRRDDRQPHGAASNHPHHQRQPLKRPVRFGNQRRIRHSECRSLRQPAPIWQSRPRSKE